jgi:hypothetical protein
MFNWDVLEKLIHWNLTLLHIKKKQELELIYSKTINVIHKQSFIYISIKKTLKLKISQQLRKILEEEFWIYCHQKTFLTWLILRIQCTTKKIKYRFKNLDLRFSKQNLFRWQTCLIPKKMIIWITTLLF